MILDDEAVLETNGDGRFLNEAVLWEWKTGLARAGVPVRIYLFDDLALPNFPDHKVFYFPNLFRIDAARRRLLEEKVLRDGHVIVWGPGTGISDALDIMSGGRRDKSLSDLWYHLILDPVWVEFVEKGYSCECPPGVGSASG